MDVHIRPAHPGEASALSDLAVRAKGHWGYSPEWLRQWSADLTLTGDYLSAHPAFVAVDGETQVGLCVLELRGDEASLEHVWIAPEYQRRGVGRALVERALETAARSGVRRIEVLSDPFAELFYAK